MPDDQNSFRFACQYKYVFHIISPYIYGETATYKTSVAKSFQILQIVQEIFSTMLRDLCSNQYKNKFIERLNQFLKNAYVGFWNWKEPDR